MSKPSIELGSTARQAIDALRGYRYQLVRSALAWLRLPRDGVLYLEVAEDYAQIIGASLTATQVKATAAPITSNSVAVRQAIDEFFDLLALNPNLAVSLQFLTTSELGLERSSKDRIDGLGTLAYWNEVALGADVGPLRDRLKRMELREQAQIFLATADDETVRNNLVRRIEWTCGAPDLPASLQELQDALVWLGADRGALAPHSERAFPAILERVFSGASSGGDRRLTATDAIRCFDEAVSVTLPIAALSAGPLAFLGSGTDVLHGSNPLGLEGLSDGLAGRLAVRAKLRADIKASLAASRLAWVHAGTGYGKTWLAEMVARERGSWGVLQLRGVGRQEAARRLRLAMSALASGRVSDLILDDVPVSTEVRSLAALLRVAQRTDSTVIATSSGPLPTHTLATLTLPEMTNIGVPSLDDSDLADLIQQHGGAPGWLSYVRGASAWGHPQLSHAVVSGLSDRGWPVSEAAEVRWLVDGDPAVEETRQTARDRLIDELPKDARRLLYRLKVAGSRIDDGMVSVLAGVSPPTDLPGEQMHRLVGPWVERTERSYRVSPLVTDAVTSLGNEEVRRCHFALASHLTGGQNLDGGRFDDILMHAFIGQNELAQGIAITALLRVEQSNFEAFVEHSILLGTITPGRHAMFPDTIWGTMLVGIAMIASAIKGKRERFDALRAEFDARLNQGGQAGGRGLRSMFHTKLLFVPGLIDLVDDLPGMIIGIQQDAMKLVDGETTETGAVGLYPAMVLTMQMFRARSVMGLQRVVDVIATLNDEDRELLLPGGRPVPLGEENGLEGLVRTPWLTTIRDGTKMSDVDAERYVGLGHALKRLNLTDMAFEAFDTAAIHWDETRGLTDRAIAILDEAEVLLGHDNLLSRARARVLYHAGDYDGQEEVAAEVDDAQIEPIGRIHFLREQAVGRALLERHGEAAELFGRAAKVAEGLTSEDMKAMHLGLLVDQAYSLQIVGRRSCALSLFLNVERCLINGDLSRSGRWATVARTSAHAWLRLLPGFTLGERDELLASWVIGAASNPVPHEELLRAPDAELLHLRPILLGCLEQGWDLDQGHTKAVLRELETDPHPPSTSMLLLTEAFVSALRLRNARMIAELVPHIIRASTFAKTGVGPCRPMRWARCIPITSEALQHVHTIKWAMEALLLALAEIGAADGPKQAQEFANEVFCHLKPQADPAMQEALLATRPNPAAGLFGSASCVGSLLAAIEKGRAPVAEDLYLITYRFAQLRANIGKRTARDPGLLETTLRVHWTSVLREQRFRFLAPDEAQLSILRALEMDQTNPEWLVAVLLAANPYMKIRVGDKDLRMLHGKLARLDL